MDSVTQIALGAAVGEAVLGRRIGAKAALVGAICGTLPDLDSFIPYSDAVASVTYHRSFSHSLIVLMLITPIIAWGLGKLMRIPAELLRRWLLLVLLALLTHPLLDAFTVYGTQLFWPLWEYPVSWSTVFIIDPAYTLPLAAGVLTALFLARDGRARVWTNAVGLLVSTSYLGWTVAAKWHVETRMQSALAAQGVSYQYLLSTPAPFNSVVWRFVIMADGGYYEAFYSVLDNEHKVDLDWHPDEKAELQTLADAWTVKRLQWFTHGFYSVRVLEGELLISDLRMGIEPYYAFTYSIARRVEGNWVPHTSRQVATGWNTEQLADVLDRVVEPRQ